MPFNLDNFLGGVGTGYLNQEKLYDQQARTDIADRSMTLEEEEALRKEQELERQLAEQARIASILSPGVYGRQGATGAVGAQGQPLREHDLPVNSNLTVGGVDPTSELGKAIASYTQNDPGLGDYLSAVAQAESGGNLNARSDTSSASGPFQFINGTKEGLFGDYGEEMKRLGLPFDVTSPQTAAYLARKYTLDNDAQFAKLNGRAPTNGERYMNAFLGVNGYNRMMKDAERLGWDAPAHLMASAEAVAANSSVFYDSKGNPRTAKQVRDLMTNKISPQEAARGVGTGKEYLYEPQRGYGVSGVPQMNMEQINAIMADPNIGTETKMKFMQALNTNASTVESGRSNLESENYRSANMAQEDQQHRERMAFNYAQLNEQIRKNDLDASSPEEILSKAMIQGDKVVYMSKDGKTHNLEITPDEFIATRDAVLRGSGKGGKSGSGSGSGGTGVAAWQYDQLSKAFSPYVARTSNINEDDLDNTELGKSAAQMAQNQLSAVVSEVTNVFRENGMEPQLDERTLNALGDQAGKRYSELYPEVKKNIIAKTKDAGIEVRPEEVEFRTMQATMGIVKNDMLKSGMAAEILSGGKVKMRPKTTPQDTADKASPASGAQAGPYTARLADQKKRVEGDASGAMAQVASAGGVGATRGPNAPIAPAAPSPQKKVVQGENGDVVGGIYGNYGGDNAIKRGVRFYSGYDGAKYITDSIGAGIKKVMDTLSMPEATQMFLMKKYPQLEQIVTGLPDEQKVYLLKAFRDSSPEQIDAMLQEIIRINTDRGR